MNAIHFTDGTTYQPSKIIGVGRNYAKHIEEMNSTRTKDPVIFLKPNSALYDITKPLPLPKNRGEVHHEIELAACIGKNGSHIEAEEAMDYVYGYAVALDLTLRDIQTEAKNQGLPWALAKGFNYSCPISDFIPASELQNYENLNMALSVNDTLRQNGNTGQMIFKLPELIAFISRFFTLLAGDIILTGTPSGVGPLFAGDTLEGSIDEIRSFTTTCV